MEPGNNQTNTADEECRDTMDQRPSGNTSDMNAQYGVYETQYFGFTPRSFSDEMYNALFTFLNGYLDTFVKMLADEPECPMTENELNTAQKHLLDKIIPAVDRIFDKLHVYASENVFRIPDNVLLPRDEIHGVEPDDPEAESALILGQIEDLHNKLDCAMYMKAVMKDEQADISQVMPLYKKMEGFLNTLDTTLQNYKMSDIKETVVNLADNIRQLHEIQKFR
ncbi:protein MIS12 homolog [Tubulanus polymorphus]|uniref:protein MIS12 homolog n=1 Tax=Tubulanus polymorphus TaxID=672921 RepID=UPI003DA27112